MNIRKLTAMMLSAVCLFAVSSVNVKADGYWQDGYWDDASQCWIEGHWVETGASGYDGGWNEGPRTEYANGASIQYDAYGNWVRTSVTNVPVYSQRAYGVTIGEGGNFANTGCVPTAAAVIMNHFGIGGSPLDYGYAMNASGNYNSWMGHGCDSAALVNAGAGAGLAVNAFADYDSLYYALQRGKLVAACIGGYSASTHCVVLYGLDAAGNTTVSDPLGSCYRTNIASIVGNMSQNPIDWDAGGPFVAFGYEW